MTTQQEANLGSAGILPVKPAPECRYDLVALGEVMLRLDPGDGRVSTTRSFRVWEGGGEYNVARGLRRCFNMRTAIATAFADNAVGRLLEDLILQGGVDTEHIRWLPYDGIGRGARNGLNFTERGYGVRGALGVSDRGHTAATQIKPGDISWDHVFGEQGSRWFHTGGIFAALSEHSADVIEEAMLAARRHGTIISYDLNYRPSLWKEFGGQPRAQQVNKRLVRNVDVLFGNEEDFPASLGIQIPGTDPSLLNLDPTHFKHAIQEVTEAYPQLRIASATLRAVRSATINDWGAIAWADGAFAEATHRNGMEIYDRVGGGDGFASGLIYGLMQGFDLQLAVEYGAAHGALAMTTPGDTSMVHMHEVKALVQGIGARVQR